MQRLMEQVHYIDWSECGTETAAVALAHEMRKRWKPPFYPSHRYPESYSYIGFLLLPGVMCFGFSPLATQLQSLNAYGCFRNHTLTRRAYTALLRLLWQSFHKDPQFVYPSELNQPIAPSRYRLPIPRGFSAPRLQDWGEKIEGFLLGQKNELIQQFWSLEDLAHERNQSAFVRTWLRQDRTLLERFFQYGPAQNEGLRHRNSLSDTLLTPPLVEDLQMIERIQR